MQIDEPRLNITMGGQPDAWMIMMDELKTSSGDGFIHRFLLHAPNFNPICLKPRSDKKENGTKQCSLCSIYFVAAQLNKSKKNFRLDNDAVELFDARHDYYNQLGVRYGYDAPFIRFLSCLVFLLF
jgi:hypothetical protein